MEEKNQGLLDCRRIESSDAGKMKSTHRARHREVTDLGIQLAAVRDEPVIKVRRHLLD